MAFDIGASVGDMSSWAGGIPIPTPSVKVTDLSPQVDGGARAQGRRSGGGSTASPSGFGVHHDACLLLLVLLVSLFAFHYSVRAHLL